MRDTDDVTAIVDSPVPAALTVAAIDAELRRLTAEQAETDNPQIAAAIEHQLLVLEGNRRVALAVAEAQRRRHAAERARQAHVELEQLEKELVPALRARAADIDAWIERGQELRAAYSTTLVRFQTLHDLALSPVPDQQLADLLLKRERLALQAPLEACLARAGFVEPRLAGTRDEPSTVEEVALVNVADLFRYVRARLPLVTHDRAAAGSDDRPTEGNPWP